MDIQCISVHKSVCANLLLNNEIYKAGVTNYKQNTDQLTPVL